ncbi:unnamed protein product [Porites evermanni]|uniref:Uncharacterized protein n=1 Tax=Porites evermanni TaxID=104178 RepID=A0ABN8MCV6_9CNID|nr:unnamed protein product [Porites evermanni]
MDFGLNDVVAYLRNLPGVAVNYFNLVKLLLVVPATNAVRKHSASALKRLKTYLRVYAPPRKKFQSPLLGIPAKEQEDVTDKVVCKCLIAQDASFHILVIRKHGKYRM